MIQERYTDITPPEAQLEKPKPLYLHLNGMPLLNLPKRTIVIGKLILSLESDNPSDIDYVEVYINKNLMINIPNPPFEWVWDEKAFSKYTVEVIAYDSSGSAKRIDLELWKFL